MNIWTALILGLLIGWLIEWVIDWIYWRQRTQGSTAELENLRTQNGRLRADLEAGAGTMNKLKADLTAAASGMAAAKADNDRIRAELDAGAGSLGALKADFASANNNLAALRTDNEGLHNQIGTLKASLSAALAERDRLQIELGALRAAGTPAQLELGAAQGSGNQYKTELYSIGPEFAAQGAAGVHLGDTGDHPATAELAAPHSIGAPLDRDPLIDINGIGPVYEARLFEAGIYTFEDLAAQTPAHLRELVGAKSWQEADTEAWIVEARQMAQAPKGRSAP